MYASSFTLGILALASVPPLWWCSFAAGAPVRAIKKSCGGCCMARQKMQILTRALYPPHPIWTTLPESVRVFLEIPPLPAWCAVGWSAVGAPARPPHREDLRTKCPETFVGELDYSLISSISFTCQERAREAAPFAARR
eukprot:gene11036-biopygen18359